MATIKQRDGIRGTTWTVQVRRAGQKPINATFRDNVQASRWAEAVEAKLIQDANARKLTFTSTLRDIVVRYRDEVSLKYRSPANAKKEASYLNVILREPFVDKPLLAITRDDVSSYRDRLELTYKSSTVNHHLNYISRVYNTARFEWGLKLENPVTGMRRPRPDAPRERRLSADEFELLMRELGNYRNPYIKPMVKFALSTAMRRGEILAMQWVDVNLEDEIIRITAAKNGRVRRIPILPDAREVLQHQKDRNCTRPFPITEESARLAWQRAVHRAGLEDLHFHDLRHEAISGFFELGLSLAQVRAISGHKDHRMLLRYTHIKPQELGDEIKRRMAGRANGPDASDKPDDEV
jgi:integrase